MKFEIKDKKIAKTINTIRALIKGTKFEGVTYVVGGFVRDTLMGETSNDLDIVVNLPSGGIDLANTLTELDKSHSDSNPVVYPKYGTASFHLKNSGECSDVVIESVETRKEQYHSDSRNPETCFGTLEEDAFRRDLTINALYYNISTDKVEDVTGKGLDDLKNHVIRTTNDNPNIVFYDDPLRIMRVIRFANRYGWNIEDKTWQSLQQNASRIKIISKERICNELNKIIANKECIDGLRYLKNSGILCYILPEVFEQCFVPGIENFNSIFDRIINICNQSPNNLYTRLSILLSFCKSNSECEDILSTQKYPNVVIKNVTNSLYGKTFRKENEELEISLRRLYKKCDQNIDNALWVYRVFTDEETYNETVNTWLKIKDSAKIYLPIDGNEIFSYRQDITGNDRKLLIDYLHEEQCKNPEITKRECIDLIKKYQLHKKIN